MSESNKCPRCGGEDFACPCWHRQPTGYVEQPACANCEHCFAKFDYDQGPQYFCTFGASDRPRCGSCSMEENFGDDQIPEDTDSWTVDDWRRHQEEVAHPASDRWDDWARGREVVAHGRCPNYIVESVETRLAHRGYNKQQVAEILAEEKVQ